MILVRTVFLLNDLLVFIIVNTLLYITFDLLCSDFGDGSIANRADLDNDDKIKLR